MSSFHVLIVGAGLGGLALATALTQNNIRCTVFERDAKPRDRLQGYRIVVRNEPHTNVYALNALRDLLPKHLQEKLFSMAGDGGNSATSTDIDLNVKNAFKFPGEAFSLGRLALREVMLESLNENIVQFGKKFISYEERGDKIVVKFENGEEIEGDLLVAADGGNSRIRHQFFSSHDPRVVTGVSGIVGKIAVIPDSESERIIKRTPLRDGMISVNKSGRMFYAARHILPTEQERLDEDFLWSNHRSYIYWVLNTSIDEYQSTTQDQFPQKLSGDELLAYAHNLIGDFHTDIQTLIQQSDPATTVWLDFNSGEPVEWKTNANITFVGDSIHGMTPYLGAGALLAIVDGWELSKAILRIVNQQIDATEAIEQYEIEMKKRSFPVMQMALQRMLKLTDPNFKENSK